MTNFAPARPHDATGLAYAERREVVMQIKLLGILGHQPVNNLFVTRRAKYAGNDRLRLPALEER